MKNIALALCLTFLMAACSSGTSVSDIPPIIDGNYVGTYSSNNTSAPVDRGTMRLNLAQNQSNGRVSGTLFVIPDDGDTCLLNGSVTGTINGFNVSLTVPQETVTETIDSDGNSTPGAITSDLQFTLSAVNNTLEGTYVSDGEVCSNRSGSGSVSLSR